MDPKDKEQVESAQPSASTEDTVEIHEASRDELTAELNRLQAEEQSQVEKAPEDPQDAPPADAGTPKPEGQSNVDGEPSASDVAAAGADPSKPQDNTKKRVYTEEEIQGIIAENERRKKEVNQKELFIQHRGNELGVLRGQIANAKRDLAQMKAQLENGLEDRFAENPVQASNDRDRIKDLDQQIKALDQHEENAVKITEAQTLFLRHVDIDKVSIDDLASVLKEVDGIEDQHVAAFKANPFAWTTPEALIQLGKRAMDRKEYLTADSDRRILAKHVMFLNKEIEKLKGRPGQVINQIQKNLRQSPGVTAASAATPRTMGELDPTRMSREELNAALTNAMRH